MGTFSLTLSVASMLTSYGLWVAGRRPRLRALLTVVAMASLATSIVLRKLYPSTG